MNRTIEVPQIPSEFYDTGALSNDNKLTLKFIYNDTPNGTDISKIASLNGVSISKIKDKYIEVVGSVEKISSLLNTTFRQHNSKFHSHTAPIKIPKELNNVIAILGTSNLPIFKPRFVEQKNTEDVVLDSSIPNRVTYLSKFTPLQLASLYAFPTTYNSTQLNGNGQTIAIIELGGGYVPSDMTTYFSSLGITAPIIIPIGIDGATNNPNDGSGANPEVYLDIQIAGAIANASTILVYFAPNSDRGFYDAISAAINAGYYGYNYGGSTYYPSSISISWGAAENVWTRSTLISYNNLFATATTTPTVRPPTGPTKYINIFCASGDNNSGDGQRGNHADFPSSSPNVIACGGTTLTATVSAISSETVWRSGNYGTGGGFSAVFSRPSYQNSITGIKQQNYRGLPDIAADANPSTGYSIYIAGIYYTYGGTSAVSPLMAGLMSRLNQLRRLKNISNTNYGFLNTLLYNSAQYTTSGGKNISKLCVDITSGNNVGYSATIGWDPCSGWGRPIGSSVGALM